MSDYLEEHRAEAFHDIDDLEISNKKLRTERDALEAELEKWKEDAELLFDWVNHDSDCILTQFQAGEPTKDGGYRVMYKGKWYRTRPIDESPKCNCGLGEVIAAHERMVKG